MINNFSNIRSLEFPLEHVVYFAGHWNQMQKCLKMRKWSCYLMLCNWSTGFIYSMSLANVWSIIASLASTLRACYLKILLQSLSSLEVVSCRASHLHQETHVSLDLLWQESLEWQWGVCLNTAKMSEIAIIDSVFMNNFYFIQQYGKCIETGKDGQEMEW